jgi:hypothetical protein
MMKKISEFILCILILTMFTLPVYADSFTASVGGHWK